MGTFVPFHVFHEFLGFQGLQFAFFAHLGLLAVVLEEGFFRPLLVFEAALLGRRLLLLFFEVLECEGFVHGDEGVVDQTHLLQEDVFVVEGPVVVKQENVLVLEEGLEVHEAPAVEQEHGVDLVIEITLGERAWLSWVRSW